MFDRLGNIPNEYSFVLKNNTGNQALKGTGSIAFGVSAVSIGTMQTVLGRHNAPSELDHFQIGGGVENDRRNAFKIDENGIATMSGGDVTIKDENDCIQQVWCTINGNRIPVRLKDGWTE